MQKFYEHIYMALYIIYNAKMNENLTGKTLGVVFTYGLSNT